LFSSNLLPDSIDKVEVIGLQVVRFGVFKMAQVSKKLKKSLFKKTEISFHQSNRK
jgi:hypothetical protein